MKNALPRNARRHTERGGLLPTGIEGRLSEQIAAFCACLVDGSRRCMQCCASCSSKEASKRLGRWGHQKDGSRCTEGRTYLPCIERNSPSGPKSSASLFRSSVCWRSRSASALWCSQYLSFTACPLDMCSAGPKGVAFKSDSTAAFKRPRKFTGPAAEHVACMRRQMCT